MPKVSIIVPNYNHAPFLKQRIDSILNQTYHDFELILLDDCSSDNSKEVLELYRYNPHVTHIVYNEHNSGTPFSQWNKGVELAQGEWIWIAESDDWADLTFLENLMNVSKAHPECGVIYAMSRYMMVNGEFLWAPDCDGKTYIYPGDVYNREHLLFGNEIWNVSMMIFKKDQYTQVKPESFMHMHLCGDWMCYTQLCQNTYVARLNMLLSNYGQHSHNTSSSAEREGRTFVEGLNVIDSLINIYQIPAKSYARFWGRELRKYEQLYGFAPSTTRSILSRLWRSHPLIACYYYLYKFRTLCRK